MATVGKLFEALTAGKKALKQGKEIHGKVMQVHGNIKEVILSSKDIPKNRVEFFQASKTAIKQLYDIHGKARELHGQVMGVHGQVMDVRGQVMGIQGKFQEFQQQTPENAASFKNESKGYARGCLCGFWAILKAEAKKYITYVFSLIIFAIITIGLICFLIPVLWHHEHLQLLTLQTKAKVPGVTRRGNLNSTDENVDYRIYLLHYCVSGLTAQAEKQFNMENGFHHSTQGIYFLDHVDYLQLTHFYPLTLYNHILPAISTTFTPSLAGKDILGPKMDIQALFKHYRYISFCLYIFDIILMPIIAGGFIWSFISTLKPWKRISRAFLCSSRLLVYRTIHILKHDIDLTASSLNITPKSNFLYLFCIHFFWGLLLLNIIGLRLIDCYRRKRKMRKIHQGQEIIEAQENQDFTGKVYVGADGVRDVLYDTKHHEYSDLQKLASIKQSTGIARKSVQIEYESDDLEKASWRRDLNKRHDKLYKEKWAVDNV